jgi:hypothetical protein
MICARKRRLALFITICSVGSAQTGSIRGRVLNATTNQPITRATVRLELDYPERRTAVATTSSAGTYEFLNLPAGRYRLFAGGNGFLGLAYGTANTAQPGTFLQLADGESLDEILFRLPKVSSISGIVVDADGDPVSASISLLKYQYWRGKKQLMQFGHAQSDTRGNYRIPNLQRGTYYLLANTSGQLEIRLANEPLTGQRAVVPTYFPDVADAEEARPIELAAGDDARADIRVRTAPYGSVTVQASPPAGIPEEGSWVQIEIRSLVGHSSNQLGFPVAQPVSQVQVPEGEYEIVARLDQGPKSYREKQKVSVRAGQETAVSLHLRDVLQIPCAVKVEGPGAEAYKEFQIRLDPPTSTSRVARPNTTWKHGSECKLTGIEPGIWDISIFPLPPELYIQAMTWKGKDVLNEEMNIQESSSDPLTIVLSTRSAELVVDVEKSSAKQVQPAIVLLAPKVHDMATLSLYQAQYTDGDGRVRFRGIRPGAYRVFAFRELQPGSWNDPEFLKPYSAMAAPVALAESQKATMAAKRIATGQAEGRQ